MKILPKRASYNRRKEVCSPCAFMKTWLHPQPRLPGQQQPPCRCHATKWGGEVHSSHVGNKLNENLWGVSIIIFFHTRGPHNCLLFDFLTQHTYRKGHPKETMRMDSIQTSTRKNHTYKQCIQAKVTQAKLSTSKRKQHVFSFFSS